MMKSKANEADQESDLREAFKIFDKGKEGLKVDPARDLVYLLLTFDWLNRMIFSTA